MKGTQNSQNNFEKEQSWKTHTTWFQTYYKAKVIKNSMVLSCGTRCRQIEQWNSIEESKNKALHLQSTDFFFLIWAFLIAQKVKHLPAMWETQLWSLGQEDPLEKEMATHSSTLAWKIPWLEEPGGLQSMGSQRIGHDWVTSLSF